MKLRLDKLGVVVALIAAYAAFFAPLMIFRPNRIVPGLGKLLWESLPSSTSIGFVLIIGAGTLIALFKTPLYLRLAAAAAVLAGLAISVGSAASFLTPEGNTYARVSPASGAWLLMLAFFLLAADVIARLRPTPVVRIALLAATLGGIALVLSSGLWDGLSILKEYAGRADVFWQEAGKHVTLAIGSLIAAVIVGLPLGVLAHRITSVRAGILNTLNFVQTIPSIALFGILIAPLGWIAINVPGAAAIGIRGIGTAPAFVALFLYSLLPVVANTVVGLDGVPREANEAARGVGMTGRQRLFGIELPLAMPVILTGIRIVLVQNIGLATIAALIGGGGFGVFVFQGVGQTAMDLVLLGAVPTVVLAFTAATVLDALVELNAPVGTRGKAA